MLTYTEGAIVPMKETLKQFPVELTCVQDYRDAMLGFVAAAM